MNYLREVVVFGYNDFDESSAECMDFYHRYRWHGLLYLWLLLTWLAGWCSSVVELSLTARSACCGLDLGLTIWKSWEWYLHILRKFPCYISIIMGVLDLDSHPSPTTTPAQAAYPICRSYMNGLHIYRCRYICESASQQKLTKNNR